MKILAVDSSTKAVSVAIIEEGFIKGEFFINTELTHSQTLVPMIDSLLKNTMISIKDIDLFAVSNGPGSFTGIRIGISVIKGMAFAENKPCTAVSTLKALAYNMMDRDCLVCCCIDARRDHVYNSIFQIKNRKVERLIKDRDISIQNLTEELENIYTKREKDVFIVGDHAKMCYNTANNKNLNIKLPLEQLLYTKASSIAFAAFEQYKNGDILNAAELNPMYLKLPQAQRELLNKK